MFASVALYCCRWGNVHVYVCRNILGIYPILEAVNHEAYSQIRSEAVHFYPYVYTFTCYSANSTFT